MKRWGFAFVLVGLLVISLFSSRTGVWAAPGMDSLRQTVPSMTPTSPSSTPTTPTPTRDGEVEETPTPTREGEEGETPAPPEPTASQTWTPQPTFAPTSEPSPTLTPRPAVSLTGTPISLTAMPAWDFGDAPDPAFPSLLASDGARHAFVQLEWLGEKVDQEQDSRQVDRDLYDDGLEIGELMTCTQANLQIGVTVRNREDPQHPHDAEHLLYLNVLVDWDADGSWAGTLSCPGGLVASEWAVQNFPVDVSSWPRGATSAVVPLRFAVGPQAGQVWSRLTLTYGEGISEDEWDGTGELSPSARRRTTW